MVVRVIYPFLGMISSTTLMLSCFLGSRLISPVRWDLCFDLRMIWNTRTMFFDSLLLNTLATHLRASSLLVAVYKECLCNASHMRCIAESSSSIERRSKQPNLNYEAARSFQSRFNNICRYSFLNCFSSFNNYSMPSLRTSNFTSFLDLKMSGWS